MKPSKKKGFFRVGSSRIDDLVERIQTENKGQVTAPFSIDILFVI